MTTQTYTRDPDYSRIDDMQAQVKAAAALPPASGKVVRVATAWDIIRAIEDAEEHSTIVIAKGRYVMPRDCIINTHHVCIRGETGNREDVILDGDTEYDQHYKPLSTRFGAPALIKLIRCRHVTIADLTVANSPKYGIMFIGDGRVHDLLIHNVKFHNIWARGLKGTGPYRIDHVQYSEEELGYNPGTEEHLEWNRPRRGRVQHCLFINDHPKRDVIDPDEGNYISGMDLMAVNDWVVSNNVFVGIRGASGRGRGAVFIWILSENVRVEDNVFIHCDKAIALGNPHARDRGTHHIRNGVIRGNTIVGGCNKAIEVQYGDAIDISHNWICSSDRTAYHAIQVLDITGKARVCENIIQADPLEPFNVTEAVEVGNNEVGDFLKRFVDIEAGDLRLL